MAMSPDARWPALSRAKPHPPPANRSMTSSSSSRLASHHPTAAVPTASGSPRDTSSCRCAAPPTRSAGSSAGQSASRHAPPAPSLRPPKPTTLPGTTSGRHQRANDTSATGATSTPSSASSVVNTNPPPSPRTRSLRASPPAPSATRQRSTPNRASACSGSRYFAQRNPSSASVHRSGTASCLGSPLDSPRPGLGEGQGVRMVLKFRCWWWCAAGGGVLRRAHAHEALWSVQGGRHRNPCVLGTTHRNRCVLRARRRIWRGVGIHRKRCVLGTTLRNRCVLRGPRQRRRPGRNNRPLPATRDPGSSTMNPATATPLRPVHRRRGARPQLPSGWFQTTSGRHRSPSPSKPLSPHEHLH